MQCEIEISPMYASRAGAIMLLSALARTLRGSRNAVLSESFLWEVRLWWNVPEQVSKYEGTKIRHSIFVDADPPSSQLVRLIWVWQWTLLMQPQKGRYRSFQTLHLRFRCLKAAWRYGVVDSIRGFGSLDPGSNPGTSACFDSKNKEHKKERIQWQKKYTT